VRSRDAKGNSFVAKVRGEVFKHFQALAIKRHSSVWNWLFRLPGRILCEQSRTCQGWWTCSWLFSSLSRLFRSGWVWTLCMAHAFFSELLSNQCRVSAAHCRDFLNTIWCCCFVGSISKSHKGDTRLQIRGRGAQHFHPATWHFVHLLHGYTRINFYRCAAR
jgi:hypothetical protein